MSGLNEARQTPFCRASLSVIQSSPKHSDLPRIGYRARCWLYRRCVFRTPTVSFTLVPTDSAALERLSKQDWRRIRLDLLKMQPARTVKLVGKPRRAILIVSYGEEVDVAPAVLSRAEEVVGTRLSITPA